MSQMIFDAHLDLSMNAMEWNRDLTQPVQAIREREKAMNDKPDRGKGTVSLPEMRKGNIGICVATHDCKICETGKQITRMEFARNRRGHKLRDN